MKYNLSGVILITLALISFRANALDLAITIDDPMVERSNDLTYQEVNQRILTTLSKNKLQAYLFVCGKRVDSAEGKALLKTWDDAGHGLGNHSYSHSLFESPKATLAVFTADVDRNSSILDGYKNRIPLFRFPFLHEGNTKELRDGFRNYMSQHNLKNGYVTVDASDWYISDRLVSAQNRGVKDLSKYRDYFISHILERVRYYDNLAKQVLGRSPRHTLLIHHNVLSALYLDNLIHALKKNGIHMINAEEAYKDPIAKISPDNVPAGQSLIWALAKATGRFDRELRYPGEDGEYETSKMDKLGL